MIVKEITELLVVSFSSDDTWGWWSRIWRRFIDSGHQYVGYLERIATTYHLVTATGTTWIH